MKIDELADSINGKIIGNNNFFLNQEFTGRFTFINDSTKGDIVIRHWINGKGIEMAAGKEIACLITQNPKDGAVEKAKELDFPLIVTDKIELANAYALKWTVANFYSQYLDGQATWTAPRKPRSRWIWLCRAF